jgi:hypothetical protein
MELKQWDSTFRSASVNGGDRAPSPRAWERERAASNRSPKRQCRVLALAPML